LPTPSQKRENFAGEEPAQSSEYAPFCEDPHHLDFGHALDTFAAAKKGKRAAMNGRRMRM